MYHACFAAGIRGSAGCRYEYSTVQYNTLAVQYFSAAGGFLHISRTNAFQEVWKVRLFQESAPPKNNNNVATVTSLHFWARET